MLILHFLIRDENKMLWPWYLTSSTFWTCHPGKKLDTVEIIHAESNIEYLKLYMLNLIMTKNTKEISLYWWFSKVQELTQLKLHFVEIAQNKIDKDNTQQNLLLTLNVDYRIKSSCQNIIPAKPDPGKLDLVENYHKRKFKIAKAHVWKF